VKLNVTAGEGFVGGLYILYWLKSFVMPSESAAILRFVKLTEKALTPKKGTPKAAGFDLRR